MKENIDYFQQVKTIQLRNCIYQGMVNSLGKRNGFGIIIDDDMNLYCSEWQNDQLKENTFIILNNGDYFFGNLNHNCSPGFIMFRNLKYTLFCKYIDQKPAGDVIAFNSAMNYALVFCAQLLNKKADTQQQFDATFENVKQIKNFEDIVLDFTRQKGMRIKRSHSSLIQFLNKIQKKYERLTFFNIKEGLYHFGFKFGLGFQFLVDGNVTQKLTFTSLGSYNKTLQHGIKFHRSRCIQQGNFKAKETITYNQFIDRPTKKCNVLYQKMHKKSLHFINQYFVIKQNIAYQLKEFVDKKLQTRFQQAILEDYERRKLHSQNDKKAKNQPLQIKLNNIVRNINKIGTAETNNKKIFQKIQKTYNNRSSINLIQNTIRGYEKINNIQKGNDNGSKALLRNRSALEIKKKELIKTQEINNQQNQQKIFKIKRNPHIDNEIYLKDQINQQIDVKRQKKSRSRLNQQIIRQQLKLQLRLNNQISLSQKFKQPRHKEIYTKINSQYLKDIPKNQRKVNLKYQDQNVFQHQYHQIEKKRLKLIQQFKKLNQNTSKQIGQQQGNDYQGCLIRPICHQESFNKINYKLMGKLEPEYTNANILVSSNRQNISFRNKNILNNNQYNKQAYMMDYSPKRATKDQVKQRLKK